MINLEKIKKKKCQPPPPPPPFKKTCSYTILPPPFLFFRVPPPWKVNKEGGGGPNYELWISTYLMFSLCRQFCKIKFFNKLLEIVFLVVSLLNWTFYVNNVWYWKCVALTLFWGGGKEEAVSLTLPPNFCHKIRNAIAFFSKLFDF